jgi:mono/diheme cytochrome c family protein
MACLRAISTHPQAEVPQSLAAARIPVDPARYESGKSVYLNDMVGCARCHGVDGRGQPGFPPLDRSPWVVGDAGRAATIVVHGLRGELTIDGGTISSEMAPLGANLSDQQIADVLTYVRQSWGNFAAPVKVDDVQEVRARPFGGSRPSTTTVLAFFPFAADGLLGAPVRRADDPHGSAMARERMPTASPMILTFGAFAFVAALALLGTAVSDRHIR